MNRKPETSGTRLSAQLAVTYGMLMLVLNLLLLVVVTIYFGWHTDRMELEKSLDRLVIKTNQRFAEEGFPEAFETQDLDHLRGRLRYLGSFEDTAAMRVYFVFPDNTAARYSEETETAEFGVLPPQYERCVEQTRGQGSYRALAFFNRDGLREFVRCAAVESPLGGTAVILVSSPASYMVQALSPVLLVMLVGLLLSVMAAVFTARNYAQKLTRPLNAVNNALRHWQNEDFSGAAELSSFDEMKALTNTMNTVASSLAQSAADRARFFSDVSHELKTPVASIRAQTELLLDGLAENEEEERQYHQGILRETENLQTLVEDLLTLSRLQSPEYEMVMEDCSPAGILEDAVRSCRPLALRKGVHLHYTAEPLSRANGVIRGNYTRVRQLCVILIENAVKYTPAGRVVTVRLYNGAEGPAVEVRDQGPGIPEDEQARVFQRYYRGNETGNIAGNGLGLAIASQIARMLGIRIVLESRVGEGTLFRLLFARA